MNVHFAALLTPLSVWLGSRIGGPGNFAGLVLAAVLVPVFDRLLAERERDEHGHSLAHSIALWAFVPAQLALLVQALQLASSGTLGAFEWTVFALSVGFSGGAGFTVAHELIHRKGRAERGLGLLLLFSVSYPHYRVEHVFGHHRKVATPDDPATGRFGESLYAFWLRCIPTSYSSAWQIENRRVGAFSPHHRMWHYLLAHAVSIAAVVVFAGPSGLAFFLAQGLVAVLLLETINYVEHYGLERKQKPSGEYEPYAAHHSWDSGHRFTNAFYYNVGRHSHHHQSPFTGYPELKVLPQAPRLPLGYASMLPLALVPALWRRVMHPRIAALTRKPGEAAPA
ncbi:MAG TPA: alkane 1-monooxygenase [Bdellovibrionota bacterium]|nr:alkane 1-monooxygenase [Bdellovibrionota bacterium]